MKQAVIVCLAAVALAAAVPLAQAIRDQQLYALRPAASLRPIHPVRPAGSQREPNGGTSSAKKGRRPIGHSQLVPTGVHSFVGIDASGSARATGLLGPAVGLTVQFAGRLDPNRDSLTVYRVDHEMQEFYNKAALESTERLHLTLIEELKTPSPRERTLPTKFWAKVARRAQEEQGLIVVLFFTDGDNDDLTPASMAAIRAAAKRLAGNPRVIAVCIYGPSSGRWENLRSCLGALGKRLHPYPASDMDIEPLLRLIDQSRP